VRREELNDDAFPHSHFLHFHLHWILLSAQCETLHACATLWLSTTSTTSTTNQRAHWSPLSDGRLLGDSQAVLATLCNASQESQFGTSAAVKATLSLTRHETAALLAREDVCNNGNNINNSSSGCSGGEQAVRSVARALPAFPVTSSQWTTQSNSLARQWESLEQLDWSAPSLRPPEWTDDNDTDKVVLSTNSLCACVYRSLSPSLSPTQAAQRLSVWTTTHVLFGTARTLTDLADRVYRDHLSRRLTTGRASTGSTTSSVRQKLEKEVVNVGENKAEEAEWRSLVRGQSIVGVAR
jgi:hypothetical protein